MATAAVLARRLGAVLDRIEQILTLARRDSGEETRAEL
jgi:hypothetical protein